MTCSHTTKLNQRVQDVYEETRILYEEIRDNNGRLKVIVIFAFKRSTVLCKANTIMTINVIQKHNSYTLIKS